MTVTASAIKPFKDYLLGIGSHTFRRCMCCRISVLKCFRLRQVVLCPMLFFICMKIPTLRSESACPKVPPVIIPGWRLFNIRGYRFLRYICHMHSGDLSLVLEYDNSHGIQVFPLGSEIKKTPSLSYFRA